MKRISDEPAYVLHRYDWSESSLILDVFTRHHGRVALVARGAKKPSSSFRPILLPLQNLRIAFGGEAEIRNLRSSEWTGGHVMPTGDALMSGYYVNELLMRLLVRDDPHPVLFDTYVQTVNILAQSANHQNESDSILEVALRAFELTLLKELGWLPTLDRHSSTLAQLENSESYVLVPEGGLRIAHEDDRASLQGVQWLQLQAALEAEASFSTLLSACTHHLQSLKTQLRSVLHYHCGVNTFKTRQMMLDIQNVAT